MWVPTSFQKDVFIKSGVIEEKIFIIKEPIDVDFFNPATTKKLFQDNTKFKFLSVFKWEERKVNIYKIKIGLGYFVKIIF